MAQGSQSGPARTPRAAGLRTAVAAKPSNISARWMAIAILAALAGACACVWGALCLMFWQGSWQLLYHPKSTLTRTPASVGLRYDDVDFAATEAGIPQLHGWWIAGGAESRAAAILLHGADGNLSDASEALVPLHAAHLDVLAFDYRGYGASRFARPSEAHWRQDAEAAIRYLTGTRHIAAGTIVLAGTGLGADLALETAAAHPELAGVVIQDPLPAPENAIFNDPRARLVPAHLLVRDRWDLESPAKALRIPSLWFCAHGEPATMRAYDSVQAAKMRVWGSMHAQPGALSRWLDELPAQGSQASH